METKPYASEAKGSELTKETKETKEHAADGSKRKASGKSQEDTPEQTPGAKTAEGLRAVVKRNAEGLRSGVDRDLKKFFDDIEAFAKSLEDEGKTEEQLAEEREKRGEPDPNKTAAELIAETIEKDKKAAEEQNKPEGTEANTISSPTTDKPTIKEAKEASGDKDEEKEKDKDPHAKPVADKPAGGRFGR